MSRPQLVDFGTDIRTICIHDSSPNVERRCYFDSSKPFFFFFHFPICEVTLQVCHPLKDMVKGWEGEFHQRKGSVSCLSASTQRCGQKQGSEVHCCHCSVRYSARNGEAVRCGPGPGADWQVTHAPAWCWRFWQRPTEPSANCGRLWSFVISQVAPVCLRLNVRRVSSHIRSWHSCYRRLHKTRLLLYHLAPSAKLTNLAKEDCFAYSNLKRCFLLVTALKCGRNIWYLLI